MNDQFRLVIDDIHEALGEIVRALGGNAIVGKKLWPEKTDAQAATLMKDCLSPSRRERLNPEQVWLLFVWSRQAGFHNAKRWFDESTGYIPSEPMEPEDERAKLQRAFIESVAIQQKIAASLEKLGTQPSLKAVTR